MRALALILVLLGGSAVASARNSRGYDADAVRKAVKPLKFGETTRSSTVEDYYRFYGLDIEGVEHMFGSWKSGEKTLVAHVFRVPNSRGTVLLVHGYYDHAGIMSKLIGELVAKRYTVAVYDQPGHGLSDGPAADIGDFNEYLAVLKDFVKLCTANLDGPFHLVAHSMGATVTADYLLNSSDIPFGKVVLMAPLIHSAAWGVSGVGNSVVGAVVDWVPRVFRRNSSDKAFLKFMKRDPLQARRVPMRWLNALRAWNERALKFKSTEKQVKIIQGSKDTTVDWKYNMKFLKEKFVNADIAIVHGAGHQLMNETEKLRRGVLETVTGYLDEPVDGSVKNAQNPAGN